MKIALLADSGKTVGLGHVGRCLALAQGFVRQGETPVLITAGRTARAWIRDMGFAVNGSCRGGWDLLVADSYRLSPERLRRLRRATRVLAVVDDLGQYGRAPADVLVQLSPGRPSVGRAIGGTAYVSLREEYWRPRARTIRPRVRRMLIALGGAPPERLLARVVRAVLEALPDVTPDVAWPARTGKPRLGLGGRGRVRLVRHAPSLKPLMACADMAVTSGGQTLLECLVMGVPVVVVGVAKNQTANIAAARRADAILFAGWRWDPGWVGTLERMIRRCVGSVALRRRLSTRGQRLVDGRGALRVTRVLSEKARKTG